MQKHIEVQLPYYEIPQSSPRYCVALEDSERHHFPAETALKC